MKKLSLLSLQRSWSILLHPVSGASRSLFLSSLSILASGFSTAQTQPLTQEELNSQLHLQAQPHFQRLPTGEKVFSWIGQSGFSYFIQASPDLLDWTWAPNIEAGVDAPMSYEVDGPTAAGFFRLIRTDQTAADLDAADFDGDGLSNNFELTPRPRPGGIVGFSGLKPNIQTSPLKKDTDADGLDDKWELENGFDPTDNGSRLIDNGPNGDPDHDGVTNLNEQRLGTRPKGNATSTDSDEDGTLDFEDAVPGDDLVSWKRTPEGSYALIEIETPYANPSPQDLNDKGEVLFPDGIWAGGTWIPKAAPELTGFLPDSESEAFPNGIGYIVTSLGWDFFNNDRKLLQIAYVHPTDGPGIDSSAPSPVFWNEGASSPSLVYETANLWDTPYWSASPIGVSTAGDLIIRSSYPDSVHRLERFGPSGALTGSMDGNDGFHPSGNWGHGDSTGTGWVASNLTRPASTGQSAAHKVGLWDASNYPIALPAEADGWGYPVRAKDLPNGKVVLTAGATNGTTTTGRVFLPNPTGQYEYATKLADKNIELFAGDGSAFTSDGKLWRNGDLIPMADLCPRYKELIEDGNTIHPLRSNKDGSYLVQVQSPTTPTKSGLHLPVDLDFIKPGTEMNTPPEEIAEAKEDSEGEVVGINWDDDNDSEGDGGHNKIVFKNDYDDPNGTEREDDMIQLKLHKPAVNGAKARLKYDNTFVKIWQKADRKDELKSEETEIELTEDKIVYLEGRKITDAEMPKIIEMQLKIGTAAYSAGDRVSVHVATPIIACHGKHEGTDGAATDNLRDQLRSLKHLGKYRFDDRINTVILKGMNPAGKILYYSLDMVDLAARSEFEQDAKPKIIIRSPHQDKEMKMALSLEGCHVFYDGHSNYGIGPNFVYEPKTLDDYMNIAGRSLCRINYEELVSEIHGDVSMEPLRLVDYAGNVTNSEVAICGILKFGPQDIQLRETNPPGHKYHSLIQQNESHPVFAPPAGGWETISDGGFSEELFEERHFWMKDGAGINYGVIVHSEGDVPVLRYASCFMASCNTGRNYGESLTHNELIYSRDETVGTIGKTIWLENRDDPDNPIFTQQIAGDLFTAIPHSPVTAPASWLITHYVRLLVEGKSSQQITEFLNAKENREIPRGGVDPAPPKLFDSHQFNN